MAGCVVVVKILGVLLSFAEIFFDLSKTPSIDISLSLSLTESSINVGKVGGLYFVDFSLVDPFGFINTLLPVLHLLDEPANLFLGFFVALCRF